MNNDRNSFVLHRIPTNHCTSNLSSKVPANRSNTESSKIALIWKDDNPTESIYRIKGAEFPLHGWQPTDFRESINKGHRLATNSLQALLRRCLFLVVTFSDKLPLFSLRHLFCLPYAFMELLFQQRIPFVLHLNPFNGASITFEHSYA